MMRRQQGHQEQQSKMLYELSSLVFNILKSPPTQIEFSDVAAAEVVSPASSEAVCRSRSSNMMQQITPAGFASLLLGVSVTLMLCGSVTFFIGFLLMPWVIGLVLVFYVVGILSSLSMLGRAILCCTSSPPPKKGCPSWKFM